MRWRAAATQRGEKAGGARRHAAVAVVLVDSDPELHDDEPLKPSDIDMSVVPGDVAAKLDGRMVGVAGGAAFLLCRRASRRNREAGEWALLGERLGDAEISLDPVLRELDDAVGL